MRARTRRRLCVGAEERRQIWRSTDGGKTYSGATRSADGSPAAYLGDQGWYGNVMWAGDPTDENFVIVGGVDLWRSTDGGDTLVDISTWWDPARRTPTTTPSSSHPATTARPTGRVFFGNDGGIYRAADVRAVGNDAAASARTRLDRTRTTPTA